MIKIWFVTFFAILSLIVTSVCAVLLMDPIASPILMFAGNALAAILMVVSQTMARNLERAEMADDIDEMRAYIDNPPEPEYRSVPADIIELCQTLHDTELQIGELTAKAMSAAQVMRARLVEMDRAYTEIEKERDKYRDLYQNEVAKVKDMMAVASRVYSGPITPTPAASVQGKYDALVAQNAAKEPIDYAPPHIRESALAKLSRELQSTSSLSPAVTA